MVVLQFTPIPQTISHPLSSSRLSSAVTPIAWFQRDFKETKLVNHASQPRRTSLSDHRRTTVTTPLTPSHLQQHSVSRVVNLQITHFNGVHFEGVKQRVVKAYAEIDGETKHKDVDAEIEVEELPLPLESKLELKLEQKMKMKLAKKMRLRRKRLVRKRQLRKKGRWPPSKMKKNKNV